MPRFPGWSALSLRAKGLVIVALPVVPLAAFWALTAAALLERAAPVGERAGSSLTGQAALLRVFGVLLDADAGARDFVLTENPQALARYEEALARLPAELALLYEGRLDPGLHSSFAALREAVSDELTVLDRIAYGPSAAGPRISERDALDRSAANLDRIRVLTAEMHELQTASAVAQIRHGELRDVLVVWGLLIGSILCAGAGIAMAIMAAGSVSRRIGILSRHADRLARGEEIESTPLGDDEIGQLDRRFREASRLLRTREAELSARTEQLETANRELEAFSYSVSHDLRAPLRAIDGFSEMLESECRDRLDDTGRDALRRVRRAAQRMAALIDALLNLSRLSRARLTRAPFDVSGEAQAIVEDLVGRQPGRQVEIHIEPGLTTEADPQLARIALENVIENAWKYTTKTDRPRIEIGASTNGATRTFHVRDNGAGFDMDRAGNLFGAFQRLHPETDFPGTGIGLAIVQRVILRHGGRIWAEGSPNHGAAFYFTFETEQPEGP